MLIGMSVYLTKLDWLGKIYPRFFIHKMQPFASYPQKKNFILGHHKLFLRLKFIIVFRFFCKYINGVMYLDIYSMSRYINDL